MEISSTKKADDIELINKAKSGDQKAFAALMAKYRNAVFFTILKMIHNRDDAEDILLVSFSKAFNNLENYKEDFAFSTWLFKIATNNCIDFIRKKKLLTTPLEGSVTDSGDSEYRGVVVSDTMQIQKSRLSKNKRQLKCAQL
jgi:RNA polymerase sigma factor (sigma-70 family)